ncbi:TonB-dependent receptor, partial [bacterium]|nr:TonB-dependent receptor [bacterium]
MTTGLRLNQPILSSLLVMSVAPFSVYGATRLEPVVVTASRVETLESEVAQSITVIEPTEADRQSGRPVFELIRDVPGITVVNSGGAGQLTSVYIRGSGYQQTLVMVDGVIMNDPSSPGRGYDFGRLSAHQIDRIEILSGSSSSIHGPNATGGVINILTKKESRNRSSLFAEYGSFETKRLSGAHSSSVGNTRLDLTASVEDSGGFPAAAESYGNTLRNGFSRQSASISSTTKLSPAWLLEGVVRGYQSKSNLPYSGGINGEDPNYIQKEAQGSARLKLNYKGSKNLEPTLSISYFSTARSTDNPADSVHTLSSNALYHGARARIEQINTLFWNESNTLIFGLDSQIESASIHDDYEGLVTNMPGVDQIASGVFAENRWRSGNAFASIALRGDLFHGSSNQFTYRFGPGYSFPEFATTVKASLGRGFKIPSLDQLYTPTFGNRSLKPEESLSYEGSIQKTIGRSLDIQTTYFHIDFENLIVGDPSDSYRYKNVASAKTEGVESSIRWNASTDLSLAIHHTWLSARNLDNGKELERRPSHAAGLSVRGSISRKLRVGMSARFVGARFDNA